MNSCFRFKNSKIVFRWKVIGNINVIEITNEILKSICIILFASSSLFLYAKLEIIGKEALTIGATKKDIVAEISCEKNITPAIIEEKIQKEDITSMFGKKDDEKDEIKFEKAK